MRAELRGILKDLEITTIFVTHDQNEAFQVADKIAVMMDGKILQYGSPKELYTNPVSEDVAKFLKVNVMHLTSEIKQKLGIKPTDFQDDAKIVVDPVNVIVKNDVKGVKAEVILSYYQRFFWRIVLRLEDGQIIEAVTSKEIKEGEIVTIAFKNFRLI
jgi:ABC-type sugar transport system ATPase subunit